MSPNIRIFLTASLPASQRKWHWLVGVLLALLLANTVFMLARRYGFGCALDAVDACRVSAFYQAAVLLHSLLGVLLVGAVAGFVVLHVTRNLKTARRRLRMPLTGAAMLIVLGVLLWSGIHFLFNAKTTDMAWLYYTHMGVAAGIVLLYFGHRALARPGRTRAVIGGGVVAVLGLAAVLIAVEAVVAPGNEPALAAAGEPAGGDDGYVPPTRVDPRHPFFPSPVRLASGNSQTSSLQLLGGLPAGEDRIRAEVAGQGFATSVPIGAEGCVRCHADTTAQWAQSAHRFSSFNNPFYVASIEHLRSSQKAPNGFVDAHLIAYGLPAEASGRVKSRWCAACHDPLLLLTGRMTDAVDRGSVEAQAGLTCLSCHVIADIPNHTGNGNYVWNDRFEDSYIFADADGGVRRWLHDTYLKANPERHVADLMRPFYRTSEYCATCHKVSLDRPVNDYRWVRGQNEYDAWHNSGVAHNAARTFYLPGAVRQCRDCHMPLVDAPLGDLAASGGKVRDHRFAAANTALPWLRGDTHMVEATEQVLRGNALRLFIGGLSVGHGVVPLADAEPVPIDPQAERIELHVVVRNLNVGHTFPGGTNDSNQAWIEVTTDGDYAAGTLGDDGRVAENTRIYNAVFVDREGRRIDMRNAQDLVAPVYVAVIPPGTADLSRYGIALSELGDLDAGATVRVRLLWRKFNRTYTEFSYRSNPDGFAAFDAVPELPVTEIAAVTLTIRRDGDRLLAQAAQPADAGAAALMHDYAIGFLRQDDLKSAGQVAAAVLDLEPDCVNCRRTLARVQLREGQFDAARDTLTRAEELAPGDPQNAWLWARLLLQEGRYAAAGQAVERVLSAFPGDREALKLKARVAYLDGRFQDSVAAVEQALAIDPEDATAHYYAMLAWRALGNREQERIAEAAYRHYKPDETAQQATLAFRRTQGEVNLAAQQIKVFPLQ
jgi:tetratricopeptide (TPR) repeat protein